MLFPEIRPTLVFIPDPKNLMDFKLVNAVAAHFRTTSSSCWGERRDRREGVKKRMEGRGEG